jgi:hypothetical protein
MKTSKSKSLPGQKDTLRLYGGRDTTKDLQIIPKRP